MYDVGAGLPLDDVSSLAPGTSVLVAGPAMSGKRTLALDLLSQGLEDDEGVLWIATSRGGQDDERDLIDRCHESGGGVALVYCWGKRGTPPVDEDLWEPVSAPSDLTGISIATAKLRRALGRRNVTYVRHGLHSVSTLVHYLDPETVFKFLHVYTNRIADVGDVGVLTLDTTVHEPRIVSTISSEFDGVIELREREEGQRELRAKGLVDGPTAWTPY